MRISLAVAYGLLTGLVSLRVFSFLSMLMVRACANLV